MRVLMIRLIVRMRVGPRMRIVTDGLSLVRPLILIGFVGWGHGHSRFNTRAAAQAAP